MKELASRIHDESNGLDYVLMGDYYIPDIQLAGKEQRSIGRWGRMHRDYLKEYRPVVYQELLLSGKLWSYLADLNEQAEEQAEERLGRIIRQIKADHLEVSIVTKMGRPKAEHPKDKNMTVRMSAEEYQKLKRYADEHDQTITQAVQKGIELLYQQP